METKTIILVVISLLVLIVPFAFAYFNRRRKDSKTKSALMKYVNEYNSRLDESNILSNLAIGLDREQARLFFIKNNYNQITAKIVNLNDIKSVRLINDRKAMNAGKSSTLIVEKIAISLSNKSADTKDIILELYDKDVNLSLNGEVQVAEKWVGILEKAI